MSVPLVEQSPPRQKTDAPLLSVRDLWVEVVGRHGQMTILRGVDLDLRRGELVGIVGETGSGKSTTALSVMRLLPPVMRIAHGTIEFDGLDLARADERVMRRLRGRRIAMIFQDPNSHLNPVFPVGEQLMDVIRTNGAFAGEGSDRAVALRLLEQVHIPDARARLNDYPHQLSGGMAQRVMIAMALAGRPDLLIADEPTSALDVTVQAQILDLIRELLAEHNTSVIMITHSTGVIAGMADRIQVMYAGQVAETASTEEIFANPRHPYTVGLMKSIPRLDAQRKERLEPIRGLPPDLNDLPDICPFAPRCAYARDTCRQKNPPLLEVKPGHGAACWFWEEVGLEHEHQPARRHA